MSHSTVENSAPETILNLMPSDLFTDISESDAEGVNGGLLEILGGLPLVGGLLGGLAAGTSVNGSANASVEAS